MLKRELMLRVPFFSNFHVDLFIQLVQRLEPETFLPGEYIIWKGHVSPAMYVQR